MEPHETNPQSAKEEAVWVLQKKPRIKFLPIVLTEIQIQYFWEKVAIVDRELCWEWTAGRNRTNYGMFALELGPEKKIIHYQSHRVAWFLTYGPIPDGLIVCHKCDNPPCVNPAHLFLGTYQDNARDRASKGRSRPRKGETNGNSKLTLEQVLEIRSRFKPRVVTRVKLAEEYGVNVETIGRIVQGRGWKV